MSVVVQLSELYRRLAEVGANIVPARRCMNSQAATEDLRTIKGEIAQFMDLYEGQVNDATMWNLRLAAAQVDDLLELMAPDAEPQLHAPAAPRLLTI